VRSIVLSNLSTVTFTRLSNELIVEIILYLGSQQDLLSFSRCCRYLYQLVLPVPYSSVVIKTEHSSAKFLKTLLDHPKLCDYVTELSAQAEDLSDNTEGNDDINNTPQRGLRDSIAGKQHNSFHYFKDLQ